MVYVGHRPILPGQNSNDLVHPFTGERGEYSNHTFTINGTQLLEDVGAPGLPDHSEYSRLAFGTQVMTGEFRYAPMEVSRYSHGGQKAPYLRHAYWEHHGVPAADVFSGDWGQHEWGKDRPKISTSRHSNLFHYGVPSTDMTLGSGGFQAMKDWDDEDLPTYATRHAPYINKGVQPTPLEDGGENLAHKVATANENPDYAFQRTNEWKGVPSGRAL